jgi:hypothetical protein
LGYLKRRGRIVQKKKDELDEYASNLETNCQTKDINAKNHYYTVDIVMISIQLLIKCGTSFRGVEKEGKELLPRPSTIKWQTAFAWIGYNGFKEN